MIAVEAMDADIAAGIAVRIIVGEVVAGHFVQHLEHRLAGGLTVDEVLGDGGAFLGHRDRLHDAGDLICAGNGDRFDVFHRLGPGGLGKSLPAQQQHEHRARARHQNFHQFLHFSPRMSLRARAKTNPHPDADFD